MWSPRGSKNIDRLAQHLEAAQDVLPDSLLLAGRIYLDQIEHLNKEVTELGTAIKAQARSDDTARRLQTIPDVGPVAAMAIAAFAPDMETVQRGRNFSAWLGLVPQQHSTGGRQLLGRASKMGQNDIRRLLIIGAMSVIKAGLMTGIPETSWLRRLLARKTRMVAAVALANKMARMIWAVSVKGETYRNPNAVMLA